MKYLKILFDVFKVTLVVAGFAAVGYAMLTATPEQRELIQLMILMDNY